LLEYGEKANRYKVNYYLKFISRIVQQRKKICSNIKIRSLYSNEDCCDCPEIFLTLGNSSHICTALLDTGAQSSLIGWSCLTNSGYTEKDIKKTGLALNLESTTGIVNNAIMGTITVPAYIMLKRQFQDNSRRFGRTGITFLVASPEVQLTRIIIGTPWLRFAETQMFLSRDIVKARLHCENSEHLSSLQLKTSQRLEMVSENGVTKADSSATFQLNSFFLQEQISLNVHDRKYVDLPKIIHIKNNIAIKKKEGFPILLNNPGLEIPLRAKKDFSRLTIKLSLLSDPRVSACRAEVDIQDTSTRPPQAGSNSEKISLDCIRYAATFLSLPQETRDVLAKGGKRCKYTCRYNL